MRAAILLVPALMLAACGSNEREITVKDADGTEKTVTMKSDGDDMTIKTEDGTAVVSNDGSNASFPAFAPQYPGSKIVGSAVFSSAKDEGTGGFVTLETPDDPATVLAFYQAKVKAAGAKVAVQTMTDEGGMLVIASPDNSEKAGTVITVSKAEGKTMVSYMGKQGG